MIRATLRLQFHSGFTLDDAVAQVDVFADLGFSHIYASPLLAARKGSTHGYDVIDPTRVDLQVGGEPALRRFVATLRQRRMGLLLDIVPNHMAADTANPWWCDVLRHGRNSPHAGVFDIAWNAPGLQDKVFLPILGKPYGECLESGDIRLDLDPDAEGHAVTCHGTQRLPLSLRTQAALQARGGTASDILAAYDPAMLAGRRRLHRLLEQQNYRLAWWRTAPARINWRRFFDINELVAVRVEDPAVFEATHAVILRLFGEGLIDGVRVDHVDGLVDPAAYCRTLRARLEALVPHRPEALRTGSPWMVVEKILAPGETLRADWRCDGTTGYDFMDQVSAVLHANATGRQLDRLWAEESGRSLDFAAESHLARGQLLDNSFPGALAGLVAGFERLADDDPATRDLPPGGLQHALTELLCQLHVYRAYSGAPLDADDRRPFEAAFERCCRRLPAPDLPALDQLVRWLTGVPLPRLKPRLAALLRAFNQLAAPLAAKAVEDTAFYRYGRLLSRNEVGASPADLTLSADAFHAAAVARLAAFPRGLLATATHDQKRGEDARARLAVLSEAGEDWRRLVASWSALVGPMRHADDVPSRADLYMLLQTMIGAWPPDLAPDDAMGMRAFCERLVGWQQKALREAKLRTSWFCPDEAYENGCRVLLERVLAEPAVVREVHRFVETLAPAGIANSLAQLVLRLTSPGVPDTYQGCDMWDFSLVDPDNRRPVDWAPRRAALADQGPLTVLLAAWRDGRIKQQILRRILALRQNLPALFAHGSYLPIAAQGRAGSHVLGFLRRHADVSVAVLTVREAWSLNRGAWPVPGEVWAGTDIALPAPEHLLWQDVLKPGSAGRAGRRFAAVDLLGDLPVAVLRAG